MGRWRWCFTVAQCAVPETAISNARCIGGNGGMHRRYTRVSHSAHSARAPHFLAMHTNVSCALIALVVLHKHGIVTPRYSMFLVCMLTALVSPDVFTHQKALMPYEASNSSAAFCLGGLDREELLLARVVLAEAP